MKKIIVAGGREYNDYNAVKTQLDQLISQLNDNDIEIVSGHATGADSLGEKYAHENNYQVKEFPADWNKFGKSAGPRRNKQMADYVKADENGYVGTKDGHLVAFWDGESRGTQSMIKFAIERGLNVTVANYGNKYSNETLNNYIKGTLAKDTNYDTSKLKVVTATEKYKDNVKTTQAIDTKKQSITKYNNQNNKKSSFPVGINFVIDTDLPNVRKRKSTNGSYDIDCPFTGAKMKMNINPNKNVGNCLTYKVGDGNTHSGGMFAIHYFLMNTKTMDERKARVDKYFNSTPDEQKKLRSEARNDLLNRYHRLSAEEQKKVRENSTTLSNTGSDSSVVYKNDKALPLYNRDRVYKEYIKCLVPSQQFKNEMTSDRRGQMSESFIKKNQYVTVKTNDFKSKRYGTVNAAEYAILRGLAGDKVNNPKEASDYLNRFKKWAEKRGSLGIPGFIINDKGRIDSYVDKNCNDVTLLPVKARNGQISFFQTKYPPLDENATQYEKDHYKKYARFASPDNKCGCDTGMLENVHHTSKFNYEKVGDNPSNVWLTEGILKSDIASELLDKPFIGLPGVSAHTQLKDDCEFLKEFGVKSVTIAVDMDYRGKEEVASAMKAIVKDVQDAGLKPILATWNEKYKGIDDLAIAITKEGNVNALKSVKFYSASVDEKNNLSAKELNLNNNKLEHHEKINSLGNKTTMRR